MSGTGRRGDSRTGVVGPTGGASVGLRRLVVIVGSETVAAHPLPEEGTLALGRSRENDVRIDDPSISRRHAALHLGARIEIEDLGSANGTRVGGVRLAPGRRQAVLASDVIELGSALLVLQGLPAAGHPRRVWSHGFLEGRLEEECARARASGDPFALCRVRVEGAASSASVEEALAGAVGPTDVLAAWAPGEYEVLLLGVTPEAAGRRADEIRVRCAERGVRAALGVACFPRDAGAAADLVARSGAASRGEEPDLLEGEVVLLDPAMKRIDDLLRRIAPGPISVLLLGETGVGKEVLADRIHRLSPRRGGPLLRLSCAALPESLLESELFGHERGAFTGAVQAKPGLFEAADGGTVFLDEVGEISPAVQSKLLRVLEERGVLRIGALRPRPIDVRFVSATNRDLEVEVAGGRFRADLYYRLDGISIRVPALRERRSEIAPLARLFAGELCRRLGRGPAPRFSSAAIRALEGHGWPGNVRELRNVTERAVLLCADATLEPEHLSLDEMRAPFAPPTDLRGELEETEKRRILEALAACGGNQTRAAKALGIPRRTLVRRLASWDLPRPRKGR